MPVSKGILPRLILSFLLIMSVLAGCQRIEGSITGIVANSLTGKPVSGVTVNLTPPVGDTVIQTGDNGLFSAEVPAGTYTLNFENNSFQPVSKTVAVVAGQETTLDISLHPVAPVIVSAGEENEAQPGTTVNLQASVNILDDSTVVSYQWHQVSGAPASISGATSPVAQVILGDEAAYKSALIKSLRFENRFTVQSVDPYSLMAAATAVFRVDVATTSGQYSGSARVISRLPYAVATGIPNVPVGLAVLLHGRQQPDWSLVPPEGSGTILQEPGDQNPVFTPDVAGTYIISEANSGVGL